LFQDPLELVVAYRAGGCCGGERWCPISSVRPGQDLLLQPGASLVVRERGPVAEPQLQKTREPLQEPPALLLDPLERRIVLLPQALHRLADETLGIQP